MKTVLFIPGYPEDLNDRDYAATMSAIKKKGYDVEYVPIHWQRTTVDHWIEQLNAVYSRHDPSETILAGFSFGAMTSCIAAAKLAPAELWLFSLSPYFAEDLRSKHMKKSWLNSIGHRRVSAFEKYRFSDLSKEITSKVLLFGGQLELDKWPGMKERIFSAHNQLTGSQLAIVPDVGHDVADPNYIAAISKAI